MEPSICPVHRSGFTTRPTSWAAMKPETRKGILGGRVNIRIALVISEQDIEARLVLLDEAVFKQQCLRLCICDGDLDVAHLLHHRQRFRCRLRAMKITADALFQVACLADINDLVFGVDHAIDARPVRQATQKRLNLKFRCVTHRAGYPVTPSPSQIPPRTLLRSVSAYSCCNDCSGRSRANENSPGRAALHVQI